MKTEVKELGYWDENTEISDDRKNVLVPLGGLQRPLTPQLQGAMTVGHYMLCLRHNTQPDVIYKQQTQGKHNNFDGKTQGKMGGNHQKFKENSWKMMLKILYEPFSYSCSSSCSGLWGVNRRNRSNTELIPKIVTLHLLFLYSTSSYS